MTPDHQQNLIRFGRTVTSFFLASLGLVAVLMLWAATQGHVGA